MARQESVTAFVITACSCLCTDSRSPFNMVVCCCCTWGPLRERESVRVIFSQGCPVMTPQGTHLSDTLTLSRGFVGLWVEWRIRVLVVHSNQWVCGSVCQYISESLGYYFFQSRPAISFPLALPMHSLPVVTEYSPAHTAQSCLALKLSHVQPHTWSLCSIIFI